MEIIAYQEYIEIDRVYADMENPWTVAQTLMNFPEVGLQFAAVVLAVAGSPAAVTVAFTVSIMTFWKVSRGKGGGGWRWWIRDLEWGLAEDF